MKSLKLIAVIAVVMLVSSSALAMHHTPEDRGKALFNDPKLGGGTSGKSCNSCHPDGKGLIGVAEKQEWKNPGGTSPSLAEMVNSCIVMALRGKALYVDSEQMKDLISYLKSLKPQGSKAPAKKPSVGC
jgi:mono/diheme cytochrome c family protein